MIEEESLAPGPQPPPPPSPKDNISERKKLQTVIICILAILAVIVFAYIFAALYDDGGTKQETITIVVMATAYLLTCMLFDMF
jgi:hypothetical protein